MALTATLALVALPGLAGSRTSSERAPVPASAFQPLLAPASEPDAAILNAGIDLGYLSSGYVLTDAPILERAELPPVDPPVRAQPDQPDPGATSTRKPPLQTLSGEATFYDAGHTAMRLPAGTVIVVCGAGGCLERVIERLRPAEPARADHRPVPTGLLPHLRLPLVERRHRRHGLRLLTSGPRYPCG